MLPSPFALDPHTEARLSSRRKTHHKTRRMTHPANRRMRLGAIAQDTLHTVLSTQSYVEEGIPAGVSAGIHDLTSQILDSRNNSSFYSHYSALLANWAEGPSLTTPLQSDDQGAQPSSSKTQIRFSSASVLKTARQMWTSEPSLQLGAPFIGLLCPVSPKSPGGACRSGGMEQEECLVRGSTLYDSLRNSSAAAEFYSAQRSESDGSGFHNHSMLYSPGVTVIKDDSGTCVAPFPVDVVSSVPVHAGTVRAKFNVDASELGAGIRSVMKERMARTLRLFEERGNTRLLLGAFGAGQFHNSPEVVGEIWADLLVAKGAKFANVFDVIVFSIPYKHRSAFETAFHARCLELELSTE